ncbi:FAD/FMN-containing dehydrogenase [Kineococcus xinjiangensis]|uniref:FAD/FMN-containing dehydrogenase n=1 Tax=Kineococcus xinjiangensis TaxID=512762 RepID=A0A2S6IUV5_9ACTN|nr:FAD-dependent oxidoreductase [Kineococcus xinjiangensis]PPK98057.1 FAD/FMN-containing dehydrogenase [Kineococcus xinjiangensis]
MKTATFTGPSKVATAAAPGGATLRRRELLKGAGVGALLAGNVPTATARAATPSVAAIGEGVLTVTPTDRQYPDLITPFNQRWVGSPDAVRMPTSTDQVVGIVQDAVRRNKRVAVRGGGHGYEDWIYNPEVQVVIDMGHLRKVTYDPKRRAFAVEAGANLIEVYNALYEGYGVTVPAGVCSLVGVGGHVSGGGYGMLSRKLGLIVDYLQAVEVVVVDAHGRARSVIASRDPLDPAHDLWWAHCGGGGGNFGVITRYWFADPGASGSDPTRLLPAPPAEVLILNPTWDWKGITREGFTALLDTYGAWHEQHSSPSSPYSGLCSWLFLNHRSSGSIGALIQMDATGEDAEQLATQFLDQLDQALGIKRKDSVLRLPWLKATRHMGSSSPLQTSPTYRGEHKSAYMRRNFPRRHIDAAWRHLTREDYANPLGMMVITSYGGAINAVDPGATAVAQRDAILKLLYQTYWTSPQDDSSNVAWLREFYSDVYAETGGVPVPDDVTDGCYVNYPDGDISDPGLNTSGVAWHTLYYKDNYPRLQQVKARWDPRNFFHHHQSIRLPGAQ